MRPACFNPLKTELIFEYKWINCIDIWGEHWKWHNVFWAHELICHETGEELYVFYVQWPDGNITCHEWPSKTLVRVEYGPKNFEKSADKV